MKLFNKTLELKALATICNHTNDLLRGKMLASLNDSHFHFEPTKAAYDRLINLLKVKGDIPSYTALATDPVISEDFREVLMEHQQVPIDNIGQADFIIANLDAFRQSRIIYTTTKTALQALQDGDTADIPSILDNLNNGITKCKTSSDVDKWVHHFGKDNNTVPLVKRLLNRKESKLIPTLFKNFDDKNGGLNRGGLIVIAANTGGGKSVLGNQLCLNFFKQDHNSCLISLEMDEEENLDRTLSNLTEIPHDRFFQTKLTEGDKERIKLVYKRFVKKGKDAGCRYTIIAPDEDIDFSQTTALVAKRGYDLIVLDYATLLKDADAKDQWKVLSMIARQAKMFAKKENCVYCMLMQLNDEDKIAASKAVAHHADNFWWWRLTDDNIENGVVEVKQAKARNQRKFPILLAPKFEICQFNDASIRDIMDAQDSNVEPVKSGSKSKKKANKDKPLNSFGTKVTPDSNDYFEGIGDELY